MDGLTDFLDTRASFTVTALVVTWIAMSLLALMVVSMLVRVRRLEATRLESAPASERPYARLRGRSLAGLLPDGILGSPGTLVFLSANCSGCTQLLSDLATQRETPPLALAWLDRVPEDLPALPGTVRIVPDGAALGRDLGIQVTPFAANLDSGGVIVDAGPVSRPEAIGITANGKVAAETG